MALARTFRPSAVYPSARDARAAERGLVLGGVANLPGRKGKLGTALPSLQRSCDGMQKLYTRFKTSQEVAVNKQINSLKPEITLWEWARDALLGFSGAGVFMAGCVVFHHVLKSNSWDTMLTWIALGSLSNLLTLIVGTGFGIATKQLSTIRALTSFLLAVLSFYLAMRG